MCRLFFFSYLLRQDDLKLNPVVAARNTRLCCTTCCRVFMAYMGEEIEKRQPGTATSLGSVLRLYFSTASSWVDPSRAKIKELRALSDIDGLLAHREQKR